MRRLILSGAGRLAIAVVIGLLVLVGFVRLSEGLVGELTASRHWIKQPDFTETSRSNEDLFAQAVTDGLIWFDPAGPSVKAQPCEALFDASLAVPSPKATKDQPLKTGLLDRICNLPAGRQILSEIQAWNNSFLIAAARDDRATDPRCADGVKLDLPVTPAGCRPAAWTARIAQTSDLEAPLNTLPGAVPPPRDFSEFATRRGANLTDWAMFGPLRSAEDKVALVTRVPAGNRRVTADVILDAAAIVVGGQRARIDPKRDDQTVRVGGLAIAASRVCNEDDDMDCGEAASLGLPYGWRFKIAGPRRRDVEIIVEGQPVRAVPPAIKNVLDDQNKGDGRALMWRSANIEADCKRASGKLACELGWRGAVTQRRTGGARELKFADGSIAIDGTGRPTPAVDDLGLTALIGYGPDDVGSLASAIGRARTREDLYLTIEPKLQRAAQDVVLEAMGARIDRGRRPKKAGPVPQNEPTIEVPDSGDGRAVIVLMDAGDAPGEVLALGAWPNFVPGMHSWDILALSSGRDGDSPLAGHGWRAGDVHTMPGSSFKLVTGLAGAAATATMGQTIEDVISGKTPPAAQARYFGVTGGLNVDGVSITNYGGSGFGGGLPPGPGASGCTVFTRGAQIGYCEALIKSSNIWFAGLALKIDEAKVRGRPDPNAAGRTGTILAKAAENLYPITQAGMAVQPFMDLTGGIAPGAQRLRGEPIDLAVEDRRNARRIDLATNSYGQGVRATPIAMATIYGSVGARKVIRPRVLKQVRDFSPDPDQKGPVEGGPVIPGIPKEKEAFFLDIAKAGLHGVVNSPYGTAAGVMNVLPPELKTRVYGKTGTADTTDGMNSAWFVGWIEGFAGRKRVAIACLVSHTRLTGGKACGAATAKLIGRIESAERKS